MRSRRSTPCRSSSTAASRRSSARSLGTVVGAPLALGLLVLAAPAGRAQALDLSTVSAGGSVNAAVSFRWARPYQVIDSLRRGLESRITFTVRLYERRQPAFAFAGDRQVAERTEVRSAFWDFLGQAFVLEEEGRPQSAFTDADELVRRFFSVEESFPATRAGADKGRLYVAARARFELVRLMPPLTLVGLAGAAASVTTPWVRRDAP